MTGEKITEQNEDMRVLITYKGSAEIGKEFQDDYMILELVTDGRPDALASAVVNFPLLDGNKSIFIHDLISYESMEAKETLAVEQKRSIAQAAAQLINADDFVFIDAGSTTLELVRALAGDALKASYVTNGVAHARALARKGCRVYLPGGLLRPETEAIVGAPTVTSLQRYNFTKAFMGANGVALEAGFTTPDPEEAAVKATAVHRALESWFLVDDAKFARICPAVIADLHSGAILTNRCPNPKYKQYTLVKETEL